MTGAWAWMSGCGCYRYLLGRRWAAGPALCWVMHNPSTADASRDDPTVRRVVRFSRDAGYGAAVVVNLFALRATNPEVLRRHPDPIGPANDTTLAAAAGRGQGPAVAAWGARAPVARVAAVLAGPLAGVELCCLGTTRSGQPRHPLYVTATQPLVTFDPTGSQPQHRARDAGAVA